jgi:hypothetical protein
VTSRHFFSVNYTFGKAMGIWGGGWWQQGAVVDQLNMAANYGPLAYDHTHLFNASYSIQLPSPVRQGNAVLKGVVNGWQLSGSTLVQSGAPIQQNNGGNLNMGAPMSNRTWLGTDAVNLQPLVTCDPRNGLGANQHMNPNCFATPAALGVGNNGNILFPYMKGEAFFSSDLSVFKSFRISDTKRVQLRASGNNFLNHPLHQFNDWGSELNLNFPSNSGLTTNASTFGRARFTNGYRQIHLTVRFEF